MIKIILLNQLKLQNTINMKKTIFLAFFLLNILNLFSQAPSKFNYQGVARDSKGNVLVNQSVSLKVSVLDSVITGVNIYSELHSAKTNQLGLFNLSIGSGNVVSGTFENISWGRNDKFIKIEMDPNGGSNYVLIGTSQLLSVPYALNAKSAENVQLKSQEIYYTGGMKTSTKHNEWISSPFQLVVEEDGKYLINSYGRVWSPGSCSITARIQNITKGETLATSFFLGVDIAFAQQTTGSISKIAYLSKGDIISLDYNCMSNLNWQYGGDSSNGASSICILKLGGK